jgi:hypothetical protein
MKYYEEEREVGSSERDYGWGEQNISSVLKKNVVFWNIKTQFVLHGRHITSPLQSPVS